MRDTRGRSRARSAPGWSKVPEVTAWFWAVKVLTTGMGETASDWLARTLGPVLAGGLGLAGLVALLLLQFRAARYGARTYWSAIVMVSVFGTMAADVVHVMAGVPYVVSVVGFAVALAAVLMTWYASEGTLSIHSIRTRRREGFYWTTVLATFALGTAVGDLTAGTLHLGYLTSGLAFVVLIAIPALCRRFFGLDAVAAFWWAYVLTRPLGASFADWMGASVHRGGLGWGTGPVTLVLLVPIVVLVHRMAAGERGNASKAPVTVQAD
ncbi:COG4705 family protein [Streptomyces sp. NBC_00388]|uniref:COG4705 family protein n=1 Tax=Streptomyces sp. NBC_00388 TaxID=2975735 RepID=UPI002E1A75C4